MDKKSSLRHEAVARIAGWIAAATDIAPRAWKIITDPAELAAHVRADSHFWCDEVLAPAANPYDVPGVTRAIHCSDGCSPDLLRHDYTAVGLDLHVIESRNFLLVCVDRKSLDLLALPEGERATAVARAAQKIFRSPLTFCHCAPPTDGAFFCTDPAADPLLVASWAERADGGVSRGELWFVCYKRVAQMVGFANPAQWFRDEGCGARPAIRRGAQQRRSTP